MIDVERQAQIGEQLRRVLQWFAQTLPEDKALEVSCAYDEWESGKAYSADEYVTYGVNSVGDPQLYKVVQGHTSQADWTPDISASLYTPIGLTDDGYTEWSQPAGAHDAYNEGDIVDYKGTLYISLVDGNIYSPEVWPQNWEVYTEDEEDEEDVLAGLEL